MKKAKAEAPSNVQTVVELILSRIRHGEYLPGQHLNARNLCLELNLSKAPVREALHVLAGDRVIDILPNKGARIRKLTKKDLLDFVVFWGAVGGVNARLAAEKIHEGDNHSLVKDKLATVVEIATQQRHYKYFMAISKFHNVLSEISNNVYIKDFISHFHFEHYHRHVAQYLPGPHWKEHSAAFQSFGEAVLEGKGERAETLFRDHLTTVDRILREEMGESEAEYLTESEFTTQPL